MILAYDSRHLPGTGRDPSRSARASTTSVIVWAIALLVVAVAGASWLNASGLNYEDFSPAVLVIAYSPAILAVLVTLLIVRAGSVRQLGAGLLRWRAGIGWYALALLAPLAIILTTTGAFIVFGHEAPSSWLVLPSLTGFLALLGPLFSGAFEELGWRGFAQYRLQLRFSALIAAVLVGLLWSLWHLWPLLTPDGAADITTADTVQTVVRLVATSIIYAWLFNSTGSLGLVMAAHVAHNLAIDLAAPSVLDSAAGSLTIAGLYLLGAVAVLAVSDRRTLSGVRRRDQLTSARL